jgi:copper chaperone CopZ
VPKVTGALAGLPGIIEVEAFYPEKEARVVYDPESIGIDRIVQALSRAGYFTAVKETMDLPPSFSPLTVQESPSFLPDDLVCYCFGFTRADIEKDFLRNSRSLILEKIAAEKKAGGCDCAHKNPRAR